MSPFKSRAQQKMFHYMESKGKMPKKTVDEFDEFDDSTDFSHLPEHKMAFGGEIEAPEHGDEDMEYDFPHDPDMPQHFAHGGMVNPDEEQGEMDEFDSSGEPHTEDDMEDEHPMEFMSRGGRVRKMASGGFARALRKARY